MHWPFVSKNLVVGLTESQDKQSVIVLPLQVLQEMSHSWQVLS